ncbi:Pentatricopeptide repeat [Vigna unguiculata]|uniref:Pentatricopeptide repeat n=1 Tax=Vigna unguiculata TaxID=3917 RepID=A0A4D6LUM1_VIGUN|nr:Pentatricopeptide repeat [Vigna unguiculata]
MMEKGIQPDMYLEHTYGMCKGGRLEKAQEIFQDLLIKGYPLDGLVDEALSLWSKMENNGCLPDAIAFEIIITALFEKDETDKADTFLREMISRGLLKS